MVLICFMAGCYSNMAVFEFVAIFIPSVSMTPVSGVFLTAALLYADLARCISAAAALRLNVD